MELSSRVQWLRDVGMEPPTHVRREPMTTTIPGIYKEGRIELLGTPIGLQEGPVLITLQELTEPAPEPQILPYGRYSEGRESTEEDFLMADQSP